MNDTLPPRADKFLRTVCDSWPRDKADDTELSINAEYVGHLLGLSQFETAEIAKALIAQGLLHCRDVGGVILVHPSPAGKAHVSSNRKPRGLFGWLKPRSA